MGIDLPEVDRVVARWGPLGVERSWILKEAPRHEVAVAAFRIGRPPRDQRGVSGLRARCRPGRASQLLGAWHLPHGGGQPARVHRVAGRGRPVLRLAGGPHRAPVPAPHRGGMGVRRHRGATAASFRGAMGGTRPGPTRLKPALSPLPRWVSTPTVGRPSGVLDLAGNVEEYVADDYRPLPGGGPHRRRSDHHPWPVLPGGPGRQLRPSRRSGPLCPPPRLVPVGPLRHGFPAGRDGRPSRTLTRA